MHSRRHDYRQTTPWHNKLGVFKSDVGFIVSHYKNGTKRIGVISKHKTEDEANIKFKKLQNDK